MDGVLLPGVVTFLSDFFALPGVVVTPVSANSLSLLVSGSLGALERTAAGVSMETGAAGTMVTPAPSPISLGTELRLDMPSSSIDWADGSSFCGVFWFLIT